MLRSSKGFTLIELLIVVVIIGILAAIAIPKFANTKEKAYVSAMKSDLRNLAAAQEAYFADYLSYSTALTNLDFNQSNQVTITVSGSSGPSGWLATASHSGVTSTDSDVCEMYYGGLTGSTATAEGVVACG
jgi:prepilin-type N-terminal cleavage/methylation domain-containing protein